MASTVHPHTRGEYDTPNRRPMLASGSPPHAWGIPWRNTKKLLGLLFTSFCCPRLLRCLEHQRDAVEVLQAARRFAVLPVYETLRAAAAPDLHDPALTHFLDRRLP